MSVPLHWATVAPIITHVEESVLQQQRCYLVVDLMAHKQKRQLLRERAEPGMSTPRVRDLEARPARHVVGDVIEVRMAVCAVVGEGFRDGALVILDELDCESPVEDSLSELEGKAEEREHAGRIDRRLDRHL